MFSYQNFQIQSIYCNFLQTIQNSEPLEAYAIVNKTQPQKKNDPDKDNSTVIPENGAEQDPYTAPSPRDNTYDVSKLDQYGLVKLF